MRIPLNLDETQLRALDDLSRESGQSLEALIHEAIDEHAARCCRESEAFGLWGQRRKDGLDFQDRMRGKR